MTEGQLLDGSKAGVSSSASISKQDLAQVKALAGSGRSFELSAKEDSSVLQKLQKWADYPSYGEPVNPTRFLPMKTPMSSEIIENWSLDQPPQHVLTIQSLLKDQREKGRTVGLMIDLSNHETLYAEDLQAVEGLDYVHIPLIAKAFPPAQAITQVIKTAKSYWKEHPKNFIGIHCAYGFNRTGFVVCAYLIQVCRLNVQEALAAFGAARPPGVKHEKFVVELSRRYSSRLPSVPAALGRTRCEDAIGGSPVQDSSPGEDSAPVGGSPPDLQIRGSGSSSGGRLIRLYPEGADPLQPWEPGTPSTETTLATQQIWESLQRGQHTAYRFRAASELSVAGSEAGGRFSEDEAGRSSIGDGHFSCSSVFSEFGYVAQHLEETYPGLALARSSMRPLPPRSTASDTSTVASDLGRRPSAGLPVAPDASPDAVTRSPSPQPIPQQLTVQQPPKAASPIDITGSVATGGRRDSLRAASGERRPPGLLSASFAAENQCLHDGAAAANGVHDSAASPRAASSRSPTGAGAGRTLVGSGAEAASLQRSFVSNSSLHSESGASLVHNESLGLDERNIFENFNKLASRRRRSPRMEEDGDEALSRLTLQDIQGDVDGGDEENFDMEMGHNDSSDAALAAPVTGACTPSTPFASPALQTAPDVSVEGYEAGACPEDDQQSGGVEGVGREVGAGLGRDIPNRKPARARQKPSKRCSVMLMLVEESEQSLEPTSPRSVEACLRLGIEPSELHYMPLEVFAHQFGDKEFAQIAYSHHERVRQGRLEALVEERKVITSTDEQANEKAGKGAKKGEVESAEMVEREAKRLQVLKRRQEREMGQLVQFELMRKDMQAGCHQQTDKAETKLASLEARSEEQRRARAQAEAEWRQQQRERELKRAQEEIAREKEASTPRLHRCS
ncbi:g7124 [Coccomyxa elongata]